MHLHAIRIKLTMPFDTETNSILNEINNLRLNSELIPFVGAGFSANIPGYPVWSDVISLLQGYIKNNRNVDIDLENTFNSNWMEATEFYYWIMGKNFPGDPIKKGKKIFRDTLLSIFNPLSNITVEDIEWEQHILLINKFSKIYTTNWDIAIENTAFQKGPGYNRCVAGIQDKYITETKNLHDPTVANYIKIIKYHGCYEENINTLVASESDYYDRLRELQKHPLDQDLTSDLKQNSFVFIGYSLSDINVSYFFNQIRQVSSPEAKKSYILKFLCRSKINKYKMQFYQSKKMEFIPLFTDSEFTTFINSNEDQQKVMCKNKTVEFLNKI